MTGSTLPPNGPGPWLQCLAPRPAARLRLVCLAHAGGGPAAFRNWPRLLPDVVEVHAVLLPGRLARWREPAAIDMATVLAQLTPALASLRDRPVALFGHSLGAILAFEIARAWRSAHAALPAALLVSGAAAPHWPRSTQTWHDLTEAEFIAHMETLGGTPPEVFANAELRELVLPVLRADFALSASYRYQPEPPLACPISAFGGTEDHYVGAEALAAWQTQTAGSFRAQFFPGGHFFTQTCEPELVEAVARALLDTLP